MTRLAWSGWLALCFAATAASAALSPPLQPVWQLTADRGFYAPPTVVGEVVYATDVSGQVRAVNLADGQLRWSFKAGGSVYTGLAVADGVGYCGSTDQHIYALDLSNGQPRWSRELDAVIYATPAVAGKLVIVAAGESPTVYGLDAATGEPRWTRRLGARMGSGMAIDGDTAYLPSYDHQLYALDTRTGEPRWTFAAETILDSQPLVVDGVVYQKLTNDAVVALDARTGQVRWRTTPLLVAVPDETTTWSPLRLVGERLITALSDGRLLALHAATGQRAWVSSLGPTHSSPPAMAGELGFVGTKDGSLVALDPDVGQPLWEWRPEKGTGTDHIRGIMWPPVVAGDRLLAASMDGHLYAFRGGEGWQRPAPAPASNAAGRGRIALGGLFPMGYVGVLARYGLPRDVLYDAQLADLQVLRRYDLVILAGSLDDDGIAKAVRQYVEGGGTAIVDYSATKIAIPNLPTKGELAMWMGDKSAAPGGFGTRGMSMTPSPQIDSGPFAGIPLAEGLVSEKVLGYVPDPSGLREVVTLARYPSTAKDTNPAGGPAANAVVAGRLGQGTVILCGLQAGVKTEHSGLDLQALMLAMIKYATGGRATPQLVPDTKHVGYGATVGEVAAEDAGPEEMPDDDPVAAFGPQGKLPRDVALVEAEPAGEYDLTTRLPAKGGAVWLRYWNAEHHVRVDLGRQELRIVRRRAGREEVLQQVKGNYAAGQPVTIRDRADWLSVETGDARLTADLNGLPAGAIGQRGFGDPLAYEPAESVYFTDDFMRTDANPGPWEIHGGLWTTTTDQNADMGTNPFCYKCDGSQGVATALAGQEFWGEYRFTCAVQPESGQDGGQVGIGWFATSPGDMYLFTADVRQGFQPRPNGLRLVRLHDGQPTVLASRDGGLSIGQWYDVSVRAVGAALTVELDGQAILSAKDVSLRRGKLALRADKAKVRFDDVEATAGVLPRPRGAAIEGRTPEHAGLIDVDSWASPATGWEPQPDADGVFWRRELFYGETTFDYDWSLPPDGAEVALALSPDRDLAQATTLTCRRVGDTAHVVIAQQGQAVKALDVPLDHRLRCGLRREGSRLTFHCSGETLDAALPLAAAGVRLGFRAAGFLPRLAALTVWSANLQDTTFDTAPADWWIGSGTWDLTNRWSCVPEWSWYGGYSGQRAAIWSKREFAGDLVVDYYAGAKMMDKNAAGYDGPHGERTGDFNVTLCGDGRDPDSGYSFVIGPLGDGQIKTSHGRVSGAGATLRRKGEVAARNASFRLFSQGHNRWAWLRAAKQGDVIRLFADGQLLLEYRDRQPLPDGHVAIWTQQNGILVPRITIAYEGVGDDLLSLR